MRNAGSVFGGKRCISGFTAVAFLALIMPSLTAQTLPSDVQTSHWAAQSVRQLLQNGVVSPSADKKFHGADKMTHKEAAIALAKLAKSLEAGSWKKQKSVPVSVKTLDSLQGADWQAQPVTRYTFAVVAARIGDYVSNGLPRPPANARDLSKSAALGDKPILKISKSNAAYSALTYLASNRMIHADSSLIKGDDKPLLGRDLSLAMTEMVTGLTDRLTELGHDENGGTIDVNSNKKRTKTPPVNSGGK